MARRGGYDAGAEGVKDVFSDKENLNWDPQVIEKDLPGCVFNKIVEELKIWLVQESFNFPELPRADFKVEAVRDIDLTEKFLDVVQGFLKSAEQSEVKTVWEFFCAALCSEQKMRDYTWWKLCQKEKSQNAFGGVLLGQSLTQLLVRYSAARNDLLEFVVSQSQLIRTWKGAFVNGEAAKLLEEVYERLPAVRLRFQDWNAGVRVETIRQGLDKFGKILMSHHDMQVILQGIDWQISQPPSELPKNSLAARKEFSFEDYVRKSKFLHFTRGKPLTEPDMRLLTPQLPMNNSKRAPHTSETDSGFSRSSPMTRSVSMSSWSDLGSVANLTAFQGSLPELVRPSSSSMDPHGRENNNFCNNESVFNPVLLPGYGNQVAVGPSSASPLPWVEDNNNHSGSSDMDHVSEELCGVFQSNFGLDDQQLLMNNFPSPAEYTRNQPWFDREMNESTYRMMENDHVPDLPVDFTQPGFGSYIQNLVQLARLQEKKE